MSTLFDYALHSVVWALCGLVVGFLLGRMTRDVRSTTQAMQLIVDAVSPEATVTEPARPRKRRVSYQMVMGFVVVVLGLATAGQGLWQDAATRRVAECTRAYADGFADALDARSTASAAAQNALDDLMSKVGELTTASATAESRQQFRDALAEYLTKRAEAKKQQTQNPYPQPPRDVCK